MAYHGAPATALMPRFGQFLLSRGLVTGAQLDDALGHQAVQGARLGTNLVELGVLSIEDLAQALSDFHKVPLPQREWLEKPQKAATQRVTRALVERIRFVPMRLEGKVLHAALLDPRHPSVLDDLRFATGFRIEPYVLPEIWMHDWLLELFNVPRGIRHVEVRDRAEPAPPRGPELNAHRPDAPPNFETTAMTNALSAAAAAVADARRMARNRPRPEAHKGQPGRTVPQARPAAEPQRATSQPQPQPATRTQPAAPAPAPARAQRTSLHPSAKTPPPPPPAASIRPPSMRVRAHAPLSAIEGESWGLPARPSAPPPVPTAALGSAKAAVDAARAPSPLPLAPAPVPVPAPSIAAAIAAVRDASEAPSLPGSTPPVAAEEAPAPLPAAAPPSAQSAPAAPTAPTRELAHLESALARVTDRDRLIEVAFSIAGCFAARVALFSVHQGMVQGLRQVERGVARPVEGVLLPVDAPSMLCEAARATEPLRADPALREADQRVRELLQDATATEVALFPVAIKHRVVNVLYASNGAEPLGPIAFGALTLLAQEMAVAYGRLILMRKTGGGGG